MDVFLTIVASMIMLAGIIGCFLPILPGPPLCYVSLILIHLRSDVDFSTRFLLIWFLITLLVTLLDYFIPPYATKRYGGSKRGVVGSSIGVVAGLFIFPPWGIIILPFVGAYIAEITSNRDHKSSLKAAFGSFIGFLTGTVLKLFVSFFMLYYFISELI